MNTVVTTNYGKVEGFVENGVNKWLGIPFAMPPVGERRFCRARKCEKWQGIRQCKSFINRPYQFSRGASRTGLKQSEDCLYLNIWRSGDGDKLPVFVWIYGGAFAMGEASEPSYDGTAFARNGALFVSFNYRLSVLGYYDFTPYSKEGFESNCGLSDQIAALEWIKENIAYFGGDENNITVAGESAGGTSVLSLMCAPRAKGLFQKAIVESGAVDFVHTRAGLKECTDLFLDKMGISDVSALKTLSVEEMLEAARFVHTHTSEIWPGKFMPGPVIDDLLPKRPSNAIAEGAARDIKLIIGTNRNEGTMIARLMRLFPDSWEKIHKMCVLNGIEDKFEIFKTFYSKGVRKKNQMSALCTDMTFLINSLRIADSQSRYNDVWFYRFDYAPMSMRLPGIGVTHSVEIPIALNTLNRGGYAVFWRGTSKRVLKRLILAMHGAWLNFINDSMPSEAWKKYDEKDRAVLVFSKHLRLERDPYAARRRLWDGVELNRYI